MSISKTVYLRGFVFVSKGREITFTEIFRMSLLGVLSLPVLPFCLHFSLERFLFVLIDLCAISLFPSSAMALRW